MLLGRQDELSAVLEACRSAVAGRGSVLVVTGEPGIGKTALLAEAVQASAVPPVRRRGRGETPARSPGRRCSRRA